MPLTGSKLIAAFPADAVCRGCYYPLRDLPEQRCPECGRAYDPWDPHTYYPSRGTRTTRVLRSALPFAKRSLAFAWCVGIAWLMHVSGDWSLLFWVPAVYLLLKARWPELVAFALLTPISIEFFLAVRDYATGSPRYVQTAPMYPWTPQGSIDRITRIRGRNPGCGTRAANEWVRSSAGSLAGSVMFRLFGPPPGAYTGPYPTQSQALAAIAAAGTPLNSAMLATGQLRIPGVTLQGDPYWFREHFQVRRPGEPVDSRVDLTPRAVLFQSRCLIVRVPRDMPAGQPIAEVFLLDVQSGQLFAMFWDNTPTLLPASGGGK